MLVTYKLGKIFLPKQKNATEDLIDSCIHYFKENHDGHFV